MTFGHLVGWVIKATIILAVAVIVLAKIPAGAASDFAGGMLSGVGGTVRQLPDIVREARGAGSAPAPTTTTRP